VTFSLVARCERTGQLGVGAMTYMLGVGKLVTHAEANVGAAASQAMVNPYLGIDGLDLLREGVAADVALERLIREDPGRDGRQFGLVDANGVAAAHTGSLPDDWKGHRTGDGFVCLGNRLAGPQVVDAAVEAFLDREQEDLVVRLMAALEAGEGAGGDTKGHRSAGIVVVEEEVYPIWDLRIDHDDDPLEQLKEEYDVLGRELLPNIRQMPTRTNPLGGFSYERGGPGV
jgi:uncharacterized Ntn-hydrolase superfamily protein